MTDLDRDTLVDVLNAVAREIDAETPNIVTSDGTAASVNDAIVRAFDRLARRLELLI